MKNVLGVAAILAICGTASAQVWTEIIDAPAFPGMQPTVGVGPLTTILGLGEFDPASGVIDADVYCVFLTGGAWSASTRGGAGWDTMLALWDSTGTLVAFNDDNPFPESHIDSAGNSGNGSGLPGTPLPAGFYSLGITAFPDFAFGGPASGLTPYRIEMTGMEYCIPTPGALALLGLGGLIVGRRRR